MAESFLWVKALHIIAVIAWMAGILYLPRLFVYHADAQKGSVQSETFKVMERRLLKAIMTPAMVVAWGAGLHLAILGGLFDFAWFHAKLTMVVAMTLCHIFLWRATRAYAVDQNSRSAKFYRVFNEVPTLLMIAIVILVVVKPF